MARRIIYLVSGQPHLPYLVCSLWTLQNHWDGLVEIHVWPESYNKVKQIAEDYRPSIPAVTLRHPSWRGRNAQFLDKIDMVMECDEDDTILYLDADTTIHGDLLPVFKEAEYYGFCATQFNGWETNGGLAGKRIKELRPFPHIEQYLIDNLLRAAWPSVNGGVWAACPRSPVLRTWYDWTWQVRKDLFIADESVLHLMMAKYCPQQQMTVLCEGGRYNTSPRFQVCKDEDIVIKHYHGDSNLRPNKSQKGMDWWWPIYQECLTENVGGINEWLPRMQANRKTRNKWLWKLENKA